MNITNISPANAELFVNQPDLVWTKIKLKRPISTLLGVDISRFISNLDQHLNGPMFLVKVSSSTDEEFTLDDFADGGSDGTSDNRKSAADSNPDDPENSNPDAGSSSDDDTIVYALVYARVSSHNQVKNSSEDDEASDDEDQHEGSIDDQVETLTELAEDHGFELAHPPITDKARTGRDFDREGIQKVFNLAQRDEVEYLLVQNIDRIGRSAAETLYFIHLLQSECGVTLLTPSTEHDVGEVHGLMHTTLLSLMSEVQNEIRTSKAKSARVKGFLKRRKWNNLTSVIPIGYQKSDDGWLEPDSDQVEAAERLFEVFIECETYAETERTVNSEFDDILDGHSVKTLLQNPVYIGKPQVPDEWVVDEPYDPVVDDPELKLIDEDVFKEVQAIIEDKDRIHSRNDDTDQVMKFVEEFDLFSVIASTPDATLVHDCGEPMVRNGQYDIRGGVESVEFHCPTCEESRRWPRDEEYDRMELIYTIRQGSKNWLKRIISKLKGSD